MSRIEVFLRQATLAILIFPAALLFPHAASGEEDWTGLEGEFYAHCPGCHWWGGDLPRRVAEYAGYGISGGQPRWDLRVNVIDAYPGVMWSFDVQCVIVPPFGNEGDPERSRAPSEALRSSPLEGAPAWTGPGWGQFVCAAYGPVAASASAEDFRAMAHQFAQNGRGGKITHTVNLPPGNEYGQSVLDILRWPGSHGTRLGDDMVWLAVSLNGAPDYRRESVRHRAAFVNNQQNQETRYRVEFPDGSSAEFVLNLSNLRTTLDPSSARSPSGMRIAASGEDFEPVEFYLDGEHFIEQVALFYRDRIVGPSLFHIQEVSFGRPTLACVQAGDERRCVWTVVRFGD